MGHSEYDDMELARDLSSTGSLSLENYFDPQKRKNTTQTLKLILTYELPWWLRGKESACQCRRHRFDP